MRIERTPLLSTPRTFCEVYAVAQIQSFRDLEVWNRAMELVLDCYRITRRYPSEEKYALVAETRKTARSIPSNVAEGHNRHAPKAYLNHINIALGSQAELDTQVELAIRLQYVDREELSTVLTALNSVGKMLRGLQRSLEASRTLADGL